MHGVRVGVLGSIVTLVVVAAPTMAQAQTRLGLQDAIDEALRARLILKADAERIAAAEGLRQQASARANGEFQFSNENLRPGQTYTRDVDTLALLTQPLDFTGRRDARIRVADERILVARADAARSRVEIIREITSVYREAREAQEIRDILSANLETYQQVVDYHTAQFRQGVIAEQDVLRVQLEQQRVKVTAGQAALDAARARAALLKAIGRSALSDVLLTEPLELTGTPASGPSDTDVLAARPEVAAAAAAVAQADANVHLQGVLGRPEFTGLFGYKRTQLPDATDGVNTLVAGMGVTVPWGDRNDGNKVVASADFRRQQALLEVVRTEVLAEYHAAVEDYRERQRQITEIVTPWRLDAANLAEIAQTAYERGGTDLLRLLDARRAQLEAALAWVRAMADCQQSAFALKFAAGEIK